MTAHVFSFYAPSLSPAVAAVNLVDEEHHHLSRVLRLKPGERIRVTNGRGLAVAAVVDAVARTATAARVVAVEADEPAPSRLVLALGLLPRARFEAAFSACVELGITGLVPVIAERGHVRVHGDHGAARLSRVAVAAMKQSGRAWLPSVEAPVEARSLPARFGGFARIVLAEREAPGPVAPVAGARDTLAIVGPEAGFTAEEVSALAGAGAQLVCLSAHRLRAETAAIALVSLLAPCGPRV